MTPFVLTFHLLTPVQTSAYPINLDGMLYGVIEGLHDYPPRNEVLAILDTLLAKENGIYRASEMILVRDDRLIRTQVAVHPTCMRWQDEFFSVSKTKNVTTKGGPFRARMTSNDAVDVTAIRFYGVGDLEKLPFYLHACFGLGRNINAGYGEISHYELEPSDVDCSWFDSETGLLQRPIPANVAQSLPINLNKHEYSLRRIVPPYFEGKEESCYSPTSTPTARLT